MMLTPTPWLCLAWAVLLLDWECPRALAFSLATVNHPPITDSRGRTLLMAIPFLDELQPLSPEESPFLAPKLYMPWYVRLSNA
jgi:hypothetical protein